MGELAISNKDEIKQILKDCITSGFDSNSFDFKPSISCTSSSLHRSASQNTADIARSLITSSSKRFSQTDVKNRIVTSSKKTNKRRKKVHFSDQAKALISSIPSSIQVHLSTPGLTMTQPSCSYIESPISSVTTSMYNRDDLGSVSRSNLFALTL